MTRRSALHRLAKLGLALALVSGLSLLGRPLVARAAVTYTVTTNGDGPAASCSGSSCTNLRDAVGAAAPSDSIVFASSANGTITLTNGVMLISVASLTITGNGQANTIISGNSVTQIFGDTGGALTLANLSLKDGDGFAGGDIKTTGDLTLNNVSATGGAADTTTGGVIWARGVERCSTLNVNSSTLSGIATGEGGAIFADTVNITSSTVTGTASTFGGALSADCAVTIVSSTVTGSASSEVGKGGAIYLQEFSGVSSITDSTINGGTASEGGGIFLDSEGCAADQLNITRSTITGGKANVSGGGIYNQGGA